MMPALDMRYSGIMNGRILRVLALLTLSIVALSQSNASGRGDSDSPSKLYPVDEAYKNPSFAEFRERLKHACATRDTAFLLECVSEDILLAPSREQLRRWTIKTAMKSMNLESVQAESSFAYLDYVDYTQGGKDLFIRRWIDYSQPTPEPTIRSIPIWAYLEEILSLGGTFADEKLTVFRAPYVWTRWPSNTDCDYAVVEDYVTMRHRRYDEESDPCDTLSYDLVYRVDSIGLVGGKPDPWVLVRTVDGRWGFVLGRQLRSPYAFGAEFTFSRGKWWISRFSEYP
jgi:hypothetical protein